MAKKRTMSAGIAAALIGAGGVIIAALISFIHHAASTTSPPTRNSPAAQQEKARNNSSAIKAGQSSNATTDPSILEIPPSPVSGTLEGQAFTCDSAALGLSERTLILNQGTDDVSGVEIFLRLNTRVDPSGNYQVPIDSIIPIEAALFYWKSSTGKSKVDVMRSNSVARVEFDSIISNRMTGKLYIESSQKLQTKLAGTFNAEIGK
jgi:hypothetical protein